MAANLYVVPEADEEAIRNMLDVLEEGGIVIFPDSVAHLKARGVAPEEYDGDLIDYDFGGEADCWIDTLCCPKDPKDTQFYNYAYNALVEHLGLEEEIEESDGTVK